MDIPMVLRFSSPSTVLPIRDFLKQISPQVFGKFTANLASLPAKYPLKSDLGIYAHRAYSLPTGPSSKLRRKSDK
jgi:hypothetical protein